MVDKEIHFKQEIDFDEFTISYAQEIMNLDRRPVKEYWQDMGRQEMEQPRQSFSSGNEIGMGVLVKHAGVSEKAVMVKELDNAVRQLILLFN